MNYLNGVPEVEILGSPKTVRINMKHRERMHSAPLEVWITSLVAVMSPEQKEVLFRVLDQHMAIYDAQMNKARVVADIPAPDILG
jgi:hypothetical protein